MSRADGSRELARVSDLALLAAKAASAPVTSDVHHEGRSRLVALAAEQPLRASRKPWPSIALGTSAFAAAAAAAVVLFTLRPRSLSYQVTGSSGLESPYVSARPDAPAEVRFSDGSEVEAEPGTRLRVDAIDRHGARVLLERGTALVHVAHRDQSSWLFAAGPFEVQVTGTRFALAWDPQKEEVDLNLYEGSVKVTSPLGRTPFAVRAGQHFQASLTERTMTVQDIHASTPVTSTHADATHADATHADSTRIGSTHADSTGDGSNSAMIGATAPPVQPGAELASSAPGGNGVRSTSARRAAGAGSRGAASTAGAASTSGSAGSTREAWPDLVRRGDFANVVGAAQARGIDACLATCSASDVRALADAARYTGRAALAERSLLALRDRFAGTDQATAAAFLLGRTSESRGRTSAARQWYETYLSEAPTGEFAADALAGQMRTTASLRGTAAARPLALEYLRRYPDGVHVEMARRIAGLN